MKKQELLTLVVLALIVMLIFSEPVLAKPQKVYFEGFRTRLAVDTGVQKQIGCMSFTEEYLAAWDVYDCHELIDGWFYTYNTQKNAQVLNTFCSDPTDPPDLTGLRPANFESFVVQGPFVLFAGGGVWEGEWKLVGTRDQDDIMNIRITGTADGNGGNIEGLRLVIDTDGGGAVGAPFQGYIISRPRWSP